MLTQEDVTSRFSRDEKGNFISKRTGHLAGNIRDSGLQRIQIGRKYYNADDLSWFAHHGTFPPHGVCHVNGDRSDNRIENLLPLEEGGTIRLTLDILKAYLEYQEEGGFVWRVSRSRTPAGQGAGALNPVHGYRHISLFNRFYREHRLVWMYHYGELPEQEIDHINGDRADNRIENLRLATRSQNRENQRVPSGASHVPLLGVSFNGKNYRARIKVEGVEHHIGTFATAELAHRAYLEAKRRLHEFGTL